MFVFRLIFRFYATPRVLGDYLYDRPPQHKPRTPTFLACPPCAVHASDVISFRDADPGDAAAIGALHVASWRETYAGILPDQLLNGLSAQERSAMWSTILRNPAAAGGAAVLVAESAGEIIGFGASAGQRDETLKGQGFDGEFGAIYVLRSHQRAGVGNALMKLLAHKLVEQGRTAAALWVLRENAPARIFYERQGGAEIAHRDEEQSGVTLAEVAYGWSDLSKLIR